MRHQIICNVRNCGFNSQSGFCLNRLTVINNQGVCEYLTKPGWERPIEEEEKDSYFWKIVEQEEEKQRAREPMIGIPQTRSEEERMAPPRD